MRSKGLITLLIMIILIMAIPAFSSAETIFTDEIVMNIYAKYDGNTISDGDSRPHFTAKPGEKIEIITDAKYVDNTLTLYVNWGSEVKTVSTGSKTGYFTIPSMDPGTSIMVQVQALINNDAENYVGRSNNVVFYLDLKEQIDIDLYDGSKRVENGSSITKEAGSKLSLSASTNSSIGSIVYQWDDDASQKSTTSKVSISVPNYEDGSTHTLSAHAVTSDGKRSATKEYSITVKNANLISDDGLIVESWMKENKDLETLAISLRNDSDEYEKQNRNIYSLNEEVVYYVDYKNGGRNITQEIKLVLELPLEFTVIDSNGGTVDKDKKTITWKLTKGLEKDQSGTKVAKIKYTSLGRASVRSNTVYPSAKILQGTSKTPKDTSTVVNYIFKNEETEMIEDHYPYMYGDANGSTFRPDDTISRAEGALVLARIFGIEYSGVKMTGEEFSDIGTTYLEAQKAIVTCTKYGLINGYPNKTYRPNNKMTKAEFIKIIAAYVARKAEEDDISGLEIKESARSIKKYKNPVSSYMVGDTAVNDHWAIDYITLLTRVNMTPVSDRNKVINLDEAITRAEVTQLVNLFLIRAPAESGKTSFTDVPRDHKLYADILEATRPMHSFTLTHEGTEVALDE